MNDRQQALHAWLEGRGLTPETLERASEDASFHRYFRLQAGDRSLVVMDAPPDKEDIRPFIHVAGLLEAAGVHAPAIHDHSLDHGFMLLEDLGSTDYLGRLSETTADALYGDALDSLLAMQAGIRQADLPVYDRALLMREMALFRDWFLERHLGITLSPDQADSLAALFEQLAESALEQDRVFVHRDYHSRNLMVCPPDNPGIIDFQDAVIGPLTYDLVSLLRDCYIRWPARRVDEWALGYREKAVAAGLTEIDEAGFLRWFDLMGVQRHLKAIGIFARLNHRDGKPGYLGDIPRTLDYLTEVAERRPEIRPLIDLLVELGAIDHDRQAVAP